MTKINKLVKTDLLDYCAGKTVYISRVTYVLWVTFRGHANPYPSLYQLWSL